MEQCVQERTRELTAACEGLKTEVAGRKCVETALRQSEARLEEAQRVAHIGHWQRDPVTDQITFSDEALRIYGLYPRSTPVPLSEFRQIIHPDDRAAHRQAQLDALQGSRRFDIEYRIVLPGGEVRFVHSLGDVTRDEDGRPNLVFGTLQDITDRKQAELLLSGQRQVLEMIAAGAPLSGSLTALVRLIEANTPGMLGSILLTDKLRLFICTTAPPRISHPNMLRPLTVCPSAPTLVPAAPPPGPGSPCSWKTSPPTRGGRPIGPSPCPMACTPAGPRPIFDTANTV